MDEGLQFELIGRLERDDALSAQSSDLVLAALMDEVEACLGGKAPTKPIADDTAPVEPVRAFIDAIAVEGFRGIGPRVELSLSPGPGLTLVVGRNGSGKSSFAEALELLLTGDNQRWSAAAGRAKVWKEGWRNLHQPDAARIEAKLLLDGQPGAHTASRTWAAGGGLDDGEATVTHDGKTSPISELGWEQPLATYRPFLSYNELGSMLDEGPSKLFDALASILGLEDLIAAAEALKQARSERTKAHKHVKDKLKDLRASLEAHEDERAAKCLVALKGTKWKLDEVETHASLGAAAAEGSELESLRQLVNLQAPSADSVARAVSDLRESIATSKNIEGTDAAKARRRAELLARALELHRHDGDGDCPICGREAALDSNWRQQAQAEADTLRAEAEAADEAHRRVRAAEQSARTLVSKPPGVLGKSNELGLDANEASRAWSVWSESGELEGLALAEGLDARAPALTEAIDALREQARQRLTEREDAWRPMARSLSEWLPGARRMLEDTDTLKQLKDAEDWIRKASIELRNERFLPIKKDVKQVWELLRSQSNVALEDVTFEGKTTSRRVNLDVTVDGTEGVALGVMSQGELHALALSLFLPRATLDKSPFRFLVIDDPVQSMDPARVDGLARVFEREAKDRQVLVFTHDDRLPEAVRRLGVAARIVEVMRREGSVVELRDVRTPAQQYLDDASALANTDTLPKIARERVVPGLCRQSLEAACIDVVRRRRLDKGESHDTVQALFDEHVKLLPRLALAFFDDAEKAGDVYARLKNQIGPWQVDVVKLCNEGAHKGFPGGDPRSFVNNVKQLTGEILKLS